jgi:hypothetical protein
VNREIADYHRLVERDPRAAVEQAEWLRDAFAEAGVTFGGEPMSTFLRPHLVTRPEWDALRDGGRRLVELAARVARHAFGGDVARLCAFLGTPEREAAWIAIDPGPPDVVLSRADGFLGPGGPRFVEINSDAPAGFGYGDRMAEVFRRLPVFQEFTRRHPVSYRPSSGALVDAVLAVHRERRGRGAPLVAIVDWADVRTRADQEILRAAFAAAGVRCVLSDPRAMDVSAGRLRADGAPVDVVYRRGVLTELVEREDEVAPFLRAYRDGLAVFVNSFRCRLSEDKTFLALLTDETFEGLLTDEERRFAARRVPWTRKVEERRTRKDGRDVDLVPFALANRADLVLKPAHGYGGRGVMVGDQVTDAAWAAAVGEALGAPWVLQERVAIPQEPFPIHADDGVRIEPLKVNTNPFHVKGADVGAVTRASRASVINVSAGGGTAPTFVLG